MSAAVSADPPDDPAHPPTLEVVRIPSHGLKMNGFIVKAAGVAQHPVVLLSYGLPGKEQSLDVARAIRRDGGSVLTSHDRGCWGNPGIYSFTHVFEYSLAVMDLARDPTVVPRYGLDTSRIVVVGHSLAGMAASIVGRDDPELERVIILGGGVIGISIAYHLAKRGADVVVTERSAVGCAASGKSGGFLALDWCDGTPVEALTGRSFALHAELLNGLTEVLAADGSDRPPAVPAAHLGECLRRKGHNDPG